MLITTHRRVSPGRGRQTGAGWLTACLVAGLAAYSPACSSSGSGQPDDKLGTLVHSPDTTFRAIDVDRAARDPGELMRAALMPHRQVSKALGAHRFQGKTRLTVREGDAVVEELEVTTTIEIDAGGSYHALSQNSKDHGREIYFADGFLYLAPRYSKFHRRQPETDDEPARILDDMYGELGAHLELASRSMAISDGGASSHAGRTARTVAVTRADQPRPGKKAGPKSDKTPAHRAWRQDAVVDAVEGELIIDSDSGVILSGAVRGQVTFVREGRTFAMSFEVEHAIDAIGQSIAITVPGEDRWVATPLRSREVEERDALLRGIAPPARRSAPSAGATTGKEGGT